MTQVSYYEPKKGTPGALAMVIALHAAGITALALWKIDVTRAGPQIIELIPIHTPDEPPPIPPEPVETKQPTKPIEAAYKPKTIVEIPLENIKPIQLTEVKLPPVPPFPGTGPIESPAQPPAPWIEHAAKAKGDVRRLFTPNDYPSVAVRNDETGSVRAKLTIGVDGRVAGCSIVETSGSSALDQATCRILKSRARFTPAKDSTGRLTTDSYVTPTISWQLVDQG